METIDRVKSNRITEDVPEDLRKAQEAYEAHMVDLGALKYAEDLETAKAKGRVGELPSYKKLLWKALPDTTKGIHSYLEQSKTSRGSREIPEVLGLMAPEALAYIGLREAFSQAEVSDFRKVAIAIGRSIETELKASLVASTDKKTADKLKKSLSSHTRSENQRKIINAFGNDLEDWEDWESDFRLKVGHTILNLVLNHSGLYNLGHTLHGTGLPTVAFKPEVEELLEDIEFRMEWMSPKLKPMLVKPRPWTSFKTGAYLTGPCRSLCNLVRTFNPAHKQLINESIAEGRMDPCLRAINAIQEVPWAINSKILEIAQWVYEEGIEGTSLPPKTLASMEYPEDYDDLEDEQKRVYRRQGAQIHQLNSSIKGNKRNLHNDLDTATYLSQYQEFYLPQNMDFRGRVYPIPHFNYQREDHVKALFQFAKGKPLGETGGFWLAIHLANVGDFEKISKKSLEARINWVYDNSSRILEVVRDPKENRWWLEADKPFQFLAACFDWAGYTESGADWISFLPIALDGSNSGIQHYSAALRAEGDATLVGLVPTECPVDLYSVVAERVHNLIELSEDCPERSQWLSQGITRKLVKRNVMTFAYSSKKYGFTQQIKDDYMRPINEEVLMGKRECSPFDKHGHKAAVFLASKVWEAINEIVSKAAEGMEFFQVCAGLLAHEAKPLNWCSPVGFPVIQQYQEWNSKRVTLWLYKDKLQEVDKTPSIKASVRTTPTHKINKKKQKNAVAPNIIHSMDASHLMLTVLYGKKHEINDYMLIHDSFAVHAADTEEFFWIIRDAFVDMYEEFDIFAEIYNATYESLSEKGREKLPDTPQKGTLDLDVVRHSPYAFC